MNQTSLAIDAGLFCGKTGKMYLLKMINIRQLFFCLFFLFSCKGKDYTHSRLENTRNDTFCLKETEKAKNEIRSGKLVFCHYVGNILWRPLRAEKEMCLLLKNYGIAYRTESSPCVIDEEISYHCYCEYMLEKINHKYGDVFADSLLRIADSIYISSHLEDVYNYVDWDMPPVYPQDSFSENSGFNHSGLQVAFDKEFVYPSNYVYRAGKNSLACVKINVSIDECGKAKVKDYEFVFFDYVTKEEDFNKGIYEQAKQIFVPLIEDTKWTPATIKSLNVKSDSEVFIYFR